VQPPLKVQAKHRAFELLAAFGIHVPSKSDAFEVQLITVPELKVPYFGSITPSGGVSLYCRSLLRKIENVLKSNTKWILQF